MTVSELIEKLQKFPAEMEVVYDTVYDGDEVCVQQVSIVERFKDDYMPIMKPSGSVLLDAEGNWQCVETTVVRIK